MITNNSGQYSQEHRNLMQHLNQPNDEEEDDSKQFRSSHSGKGRAGAARKNHNNSDVFGEFPPQMMQSTSNKTYNPSKFQHKTTRFAMDEEATASRTSSSSNLNMGSTKKVLVLEPSDNGKTTNSSRHNAISTPTTTKYPDSSCLDFSMIATPGGGKLARMVYDDGGDSASLRSEGTSSVASSGLWPTGTPFSSLLRGVVSSTPGIRPRKILSATPYTAARSRNEDYQPTPGENNTLDGDDECTALMFARSAPLSGYLRKMGKNIPKFKRRFFVLKPSTHLYYFMSPTDVEPRGCIDLDLTRETGEGGGCEVREIGLLPDGTFRFELLFDEEADEDEMNNSLMTDDASDTGSRTSQYSKRREFQRQSIILEARTEEIGREWMAKLQSERLSAARDEVDFLKITMAEVNAASSRWERSAFEEGARANDAENKRDVAVLEAKAWESKFNDLNEAIRLIGEKATRQSNSSTTAQSNSTISEKVNDISEVGDQTNDVDESFSFESMARALDGFDINDTHFHDLLKAFQNIQNDLSNKANKRAEKLEQRAVEAEYRLAKADAELRGIWEDNCAIQKELKKARREKKVLVKEVRAMHAAASAVEESKKEINRLRPAAQDRSMIAEKYVAQQSCLSSTNSRSDSKCDASDSTYNPPTQRKLMEEERRLVFELEEHVMSGLRLSEQFLTMNGIEPSVVDDDIDSLYQTSKASINRTPERQHDLNSFQLSSDFFNAPTEKSKNEKTRPFVHHSAMERQLCSLLDDASLPNEDTDTLGDKNEDDASDFQSEHGLGLRYQNEKKSCLQGNPSNNEKDSNKSVGIETSDSVVSSEEQHDCQIISCEGDNEVSGETSINQNLYHRFEENREVKEINNTIATYTNSDSDNNPASTQHFVDQQQKAQPTFQLEDNSADIALPSVDMISAVSEASQSRVTENGQATTKLECPLKDVGETPHPTRRRSTLGDDGRVYHITFYSSKIGLQFQKVPNETKSTGILTDAMTMDHGPSAEIDRTAAELRRIAAISQQSMSHNNQQYHAMECLPVTPADAVLVCGFLGFDDSTGNIRPRVGARLVAFDGIPVEVGKWTFESIRKSIQARGRPLTLSFRNDFLTPKQRTILTKAVEDMHAYVPSRPLPPPNSTESVPVSLKADHSANGNENASITSASSLSSRNHLQRNKYYSFSEAGSSISSAVAPLMSNLMTGLSNGKSRHEEFAPDYLRRQSDSLEKMSHHRDFKSSLL